jgi:hypothetical protein
MKKRMLCVLLNCIYFFAYSQNNNSKFSTIGQKKYLRQENIFFSERKKNTIYDSLNYKNQISHWSIYVGYGIGKNTKILDEMLYTVRPDFSSGGSTKKVEKMETNLGEEICFGVLYNAFNSEKVKIVIGVDYSKYKQQGKIIKQSVTTWKEVFVPPNGHTFEYNTWYDNNAYNFYRKESYFRFPTYINLLIFKYKKTEYSFDIGGISGIKNLKIDAGQYSRNINALAFFLYSGFVVNYNFYKENRIYIEPTFKYEFTGEGKKIIGSLILAYKI